jgi:hypothetical protein
MLRAIGRLIWEHYELRERKSFKESFLFNIIKDPRWTYSLVFFLDVSLCFDG